MAVTLDLIVKRLSTVETVRYSGPTSQGHGTYMINLIGHLPEGPVHIHARLELEAIIQLKTRIDAALEHMKTH